MIKPIKGPEDTSEEKQGNQKEFDLEVWFANILRIYRSPS
jgi:hypothetical protein